MKGERVTPYSRRAVDDELDELLDGLPAISLEGPRGVGKTETARQRSATVHRLDVPSERTVAEAEPERLTRGPYPVLLDEWQRLPEVWDRVRRAVDDGAEPGSFLLTGSAMPDAPGLHSGAGRIVSLRMRPMTLAERGATSPTVSLRSLLSGGGTPVTGSSSLTLEDYAREITSSGLPGIRTLSGRALESRLDGYLDALLDKDFADFGYRVRNRSALRRWLTAYAAATSTTAAYERIRAAASAGEGGPPARTTTQPYRDVLERLYIVDPLPAWIPTRNRMRRLAEPPKHHLADPALAARLLGVGADALLRGDGGQGPWEGPLLGALFESLVTLQVRLDARAAQGRVGHLRTRGGEHEVDLIVERPDGRVLAVEVKLAAAVRDDDVRHLLWLRGQLGPDLLDAVVVTTGRDAYRRQDGVAVVPLALLGP